MSGDIRLISVMEVGKGSGTVDAEVCMCNGGSMPRDDMTPFRSFAAMYIPFEKRRVIAEYARASNID